VSLFFVDSRNPIVPPVVLVPDWDEALRRVSLRQPASTVSVFAQITMEQARDLAQTCRRIEPLVIAEMKAGRCTTQADTVTFIRADTEGFFPAVRFCQRMRDVVGSEATPATWPQVIAAAITEEA